jgi:hypothetical protein
MLPNEKKNQASKIITILNKNKIFHLAANEPNKPFRLYPPYN